MAGYHRLGSHRLDGGQRVHPSPVGSLPADRRAAVEHHIAGEHHPLVRNADDQVARGVGRADISDLCLQAVEIERQVAVDHPVGGHQLHVVKVELAECCHQSGQAGGRVLHSGHCCGLRGGELVKPLGAAGVGDDLRVLEDLVPPAVIAVVVGVDHSGRGLGMHFGVQIGHLGGEPLVVEGVDHHATSSSNETRVAPAQAPVGLQAGVQTGADRHKIHGLAPSSGFEAQTAENHNSLSRVPSDRTPGLVPN